MSPTACFVSASRQNVFFAELLDALADELAGQGVIVERAVDHFPAPRDGLAYVFVPHELMPLLMADAHPSEHQLRRSVAVCTEQPGTHWFDETAQIAARVARSVDINRVGVAALRALGIDARFLQLGYTERWDRWHGDPDARRPIDVTLLAGATPRRLTAVAGCADQLAARRTELHLPEAIVPHRAESELFLSGNRKWDLLARSRLLLNIHRSALGYFEWQRAVEAIVNGCVLLSEHSLGFAPLVPGEHFISVSCESLDVALEGVLDDEPRLARMRSSAYELLRGEYPLSSSIAVLAEAVVDAARQPATSSARDAGPVLARPKSPQLPPAAWELTGAYVGSQAVRRKVAQVLVDQREMRASPHELKALQPGTTGGDRIERLGAAGDRAPRVTVVLTMLDQSTSIPAAIDSVAISNFTDLELLIVDDTSGDDSDSDERIHAALADAWWLRTTIVRRARPDGLGRARNVACEQAAGEFVFFMTACDSLYPGGLGRLVEALDEAPEAAFAYGIVARAHGRDVYDDRDGLTGYLGWDPAMLRYGNYIDSMALVRRRSLIEVGGYAVDPPLAGWEDLALWCAFADRGWRGVHVAEIVAREQAPVRAVPAEIDASAAWALLLDRFRCLSASAAA